MHRVHAVSALVIGLTTTYVTAALAQGEAPETAAPGPQNLAPNGKGAAQATPATAGSDSGYHQHGGFYLRLTIGGGYVHNSMNGRDGISAKVYGATVPFEIMVGGTIASGLALGLGITPSPILDPKATFEGRTATIFSDYRVQYSRLGPFVDYYPNPHQGLHVLGSLNYAGFTIIEDATDKTIGNAKGIALTAGIGYAIWLSGNWSLGILGQLSYAQLWAPRESHRIIAPAAMLEIVYH